MSQELPGRRPANPLRARAVVGLQRRPAAPSRRQLRPPPDAMAKSADSWAFIPPERQNIFA